MLKDCMSACCLWSQPVKRGTFAGDKEQENKHRYYVVDAQISINYIQQWYYSRIHWRFSAQVYERVGSDYERLSAFVIDALNVSFRNHVPIFVFHPFIPFIIHFPKLRIVFARKNTNRHTLHWCGMCLFAMHVALYQFSKIINLLFPVWYC